MADFLPQDGLKGSLVVVKARVTSLVALHSFPDGFTEQVGKGTESEIRAC